MIWTQPKPGLHAETERTMADTVPSQPTSSHDADLKQHSDERFARLEEELARQNNSQKMKTRILFAFVALGLIVWAWAALR
jgi:hypothetical protein